MKTENSQLLYDRAQRVITAGVNSNSRARSPHPLYFARADGPFVWDVDGNRYIDLGMGNGAILLGHNNPLVRAAVERALANGITTGLETESAIRAAELFIRIVPYAERVRFTNTGTEALMHAVQIARAKTGRRRIAKIEGAYHGWTDAVFASTWPNLALAGPDNAPIPLPGTGGLDSAMIQDTIVIPFNDIAAAETILRANANDLAAILVEPTMIDVGFIPAERAFLVQLRQLASEIGAVLIFDELLTGFRLARGGAQEFYDVQADLAMFGKALGNGFPVAAVAGKAEFLEKSAPGSGNTTFVGTFNGHAVVMAAVEASLAQLADGRATRDLHARTSALIEEFGTFARRHGVAAQMYGGGGHIHWYFTDRPVRNYRDAARSNAKRYSAFITTLAEAGFLVSPNYLLHHAISLAHSQSELEQLVQAMERGLEAAAKIPD